MSAPNPRKRPAPGAAPAMAMPQTQQPFVLSPQDPLLGWNAALPDGSGTYIDPAANVSQYMLNAQPQYAQGFQQNPAPTQMSTSTAIARRPPNRALVPTRPSLPPYDGSSNAWTFHTDADGETPSTSNEAVDDSDNIEALEAKARQVKQEAQKSRKSIPPFVQKLSSYLEEQKNTDLIRWSDKGDSFIVLDEDEFARTLIPELFKHNNYASFVRQLNMYGFHKRVGLSDNSMKASERKNKSPSEYVNPYFRRGHPNLLWLINKPKSSKRGNQSAKKEEPRDGDSEDEAVVDEAVPQTYPPAQTPGPRSLPPASDFVQLHRADLERIGKHIASLQEQQKTMSGIISKLRNDHNALYQQAVAFQTMHERHENSINAILNFLANVFRKSLEDQGAQNGVQDLLASIIPNAQIPKGSVVDLGDFSEAFQHQPSPAPNPTATPRRQQRLLPPIPQQGRAGSNPPSVPGTTNPQAAPYRTGTVGPTGTVTELYDTPSEAPTPDYLRHELQSNPQESMMKIINGTNAGSAATAFDLPEMAANTPVNLTNEQRNKLVGVMSGHSAAPTPAPSGQQAPVAAPMANHAPAAAPNPAPSTSPINSLSPFLKSSIPPPFPELQKDSEEVEQLRRLSADQSHKIEDLSHLLVSYSPSGHIPGLDYEGSQGPGYFDIDQFITNDAYDNDAAFNGGDFSGADAHGHHALGPDGTDFNFSLDPGYSNANSVGNLPVPGTTEPHSSGNTPSPAGTEEIPRHDLDQSPVSNSKRRRVS